MPDTPRMRLLVTVIVLLGCLGIVFAGTLVESRWTGSMSPCTRPIGDSTWQEGTSSARWFPPSIHCEFSATDNDSFVERKLPPESTNHFAAIGVGLLGVLVSVVIGIALLVFGARRFVRRHSLTREGGATLGSR